MCLCIMNQINWYACVCNKLIIFKGQICKILCEPNLLKKKPPLGDSFVKTIYAQMHKDLC